MRKSRVVAAVTAGLLIGVAGPAALAGVQQTASTTIQNMGTVSGTCYLGQATVYNNPGGSSATYAKQSNCSTAKTVPTGYMGSQFVVMRNGAVCTNSNVSYSNSARSTWTFTILPTQNCGSGNYTAEGWSWMYETASGNYKINDTTNTPVVVK